MGILKTRVRTYVLVCMQEPEEGIEGSGTRLSGGCEVQFEYWKLNWVLYKSSFVLND